MRFSWRQVSFYFLLKPSDFFIWINKAFKQDIPSIWVLQAYTLFIQKMLEADLCPPICLSVTILEAQTKFGRGF